MTLSGELSTGKVFLVDGKRTPFGKFGGSLKDISPVDLAVHATKGLLESTKVRAKDINHFILGNVVPSTTDAMYGGRHLALKSGADIETPGYCVNRLCGSGIQSILDAFRLIRFNDASAVIAAGTENMSIIPHLTYGSRFGTKYGALQVVDMLMDALTDKYAGCPMGITAENLSEKFGITREECDQYSLESHQKLNQAYEKGLVQGELVSIELKRGVCDRDEHFRADCSLADMNKLRASFKKDGVVTPGSASGIVDGAASSLIASEAFVKDKGLTPLAEILDGVVVGVDPNIMGIGPSPAIQQILERNQLKLSDIDLIEINEAFAGQTLACIKDLDLDTSKLNIWGGAIAVGHPLAASGTRIAVSVARQMKELNKELAIASACIGGGQGIAILLKRA